MEKKIYFIRHCEATGQTPDAPLTKNGFRQAEHLANFFSEFKIDRIISSPFLRAIQTAKPISSMKEIPIEEEVRLAERVLSGTVLSDWMEKLEQTFIDFDLAFDGGESSREATERAVQVIEEILISNSKNTIIVSHGNLLALLIKHFDQSFGFEEWKKMTNPDVFQLKIIEEKMEIKRIWSEND